MRALHHEPSPSRRGPRLTPAQAVAFGLVAASVGWALWLVRDRPAAEEVELLPGTVLPSSELAIVEAAFDRAQLAEHRTEDGRVWVPRPRQSAYMRALVDAEALPREFGSSLRRAVEGNSPWQSRAVQEESLRIAVQEELAHVICSMPGIERAAVLYDVAERPGLGGGAPLRTASVNVRTQPDVELEPARVQAIRVLVAASIAGLEPDRVAVTDLRSGRVYAGPLAAPPESLEVAADADLARRIAHERHLTTKLRQALSFVKGAVVDVTVGFAAPPPAPPSALEPEPTQRLADANSPAEVAPPAPPRHEPPAVTSGPTTIRASVVVPDAYLRAAAAADRDAGADPTAAFDRERARLVAHVRSVLPPTPRPEDLQVSITTFPTGGLQRAATRPAAPPAPRGGDRAAAAGPAATDRAAEERLAAALFAARAVAAETWAAVARGEPAAVPRQAWIVAAALSALVLLAVIVRGPVAGGRRAPADPSPARIDWSALEAAADEPVDDAAGSRPSRRVAA
jgi:type III secretory pathway lipoprotein EscJ